MAHDVFISYASEDKAVADAVCATLESRKIRCWIAPRDVLPGKTYAEALIDAISQSKLLVLVFSQNSNKSQQVMREVERSVNKGIPILPFRIEDVTPTKAMEYFLSVPHWLDALTPPLEKHLNKLADTVQVLLNTTQAPEEEPPPREPTPKPKSSKKPVLLGVGVVVVIAAVIAILFATGLFGGKKGGEKLANNPPSTLTGSPTPIGQDFSTTNPDSQSSSQTTTPIPTSTSTITPTSTLSTITGTFSNSDQLVSGSSVKGNLPKGAAQFYYFNADVGDAAYITLTEGDPDSEMCPMLELLGPDGKKITGNWGSTYYQIDWPVTADGKYTVRVRDYANVGGNYVLSFMQLSKPVNPLTSGVTLQGVLKVPGEANWFTFDAKAGDAAFIVLTEGTDTESMLPWLELMGPDGKKVAGNWGSTYYTIDKGLTLDGKYTVKVRDYANIGGNYVLSFLQSSKSVNPLDSGVSLQGQLKVPGDINWYSFTANEGDAAYMILTESTGASDMCPMLELFGPDGNKVAGNWGSTYYQIYQPITKSGQYTIRVRDYANIGGNYVLSFMQVSKPVSTITSGAMIQGQLKVPGDVNWYTFNVSIQTAIFAVLSEGDNSDAMLPWFELIGPDGIKITGNWGSTSYTIDQPLTTPGIYTLVVRDYANTACKYVLSFNLMQ